MKRFPLIAQLVNKGKPIYTIVFILVGVIMSPDLDLTTCFNPSRWVNSLSNPHSASYSVIFNVMAKSACFLLNNLCSFSFIVMTTSPASWSGYSSALPSKVYLWLLGTPLSRLTSRVSFSLIIFWVLHFLHFFPFGMMVPSPWHLSQCPVVCVYMPGPNWTILVTCPWPLHWEHVVAPTPPFPSHSLHSLYLSILSFFVLPA